MLLTEPYRSVPFPHSSLHISVKKAKLWKVVKVNGKEESREVFNTSNYQASPKIVRVGTASDSQDAINAVMAAIGTQDEATIQAAAAANCTAAVMRQRHSRQQKQRQRQQHSLQNRHSRSSQASRKKITRMTRRIPIKKTTTTMTIRRIPRKKRIIREMIKTAL